MKIVSVTPIKLNNVRLPGKNTMLLAGKPLCEYLFSTLQGISTDLIQEKYVFCSDEAICPYIPEGLTFLKRDPVLDGPKVRGLQIYESFCRAVDADVYVLCHVTAPFLKRENLENAVRQMQTGEYDSAFTAEMMQDYCWYDGKPVNYELTDIVQTQDLKPVCVEKGEVFIFTKEVLTKFHRRIGLNPYIQQISEIEAIDIDTPEDFEFARIVAESFFAKQGGGR